MSSQVGKGSESEAWGFELSVDEVVLLALLNMFKQTCTPSPKMKNCHLYKAYRYVDFIKGPQSSWDQEKHTPISKQGPFKGTGTFMNLVEKMRQHFELFQGKKKDTTAGRSVYKLSFI